MNGFAGRTKKKKVTVVSTMKRPVPLEHYILAKVNNQTTTANNANTRTKCTLSIDSTQANRYVWQPFELLSLSLM